MGEAALDWIKPQTYNFQKAALLLAMDVHGTVTHL